MIAMTSTVLFDGPKRVVVQLSGIADGPGDEINIPVVDPTSLTPVCRTVKIDTVEYDVSGGLVQLIWDDLGDPSVALAMTGQATKDYRPVGGNMHPIGAAGGTVTNTGGLLLSTLGFDAGSSYTITINCQKKY